jgi:hypothetical protein
MRRLDGLTGTGAGAIRQSRPLLPPVLALCVAVVACVTVTLFLGACGGSPEAAATATVASPTPVPSPLVTEGPPPAGAAEVVRLFWRLVGEGRLAEAKRELVAPGAPIQSWKGDDIAGARFVRLVPDSTAAAPPEGATVEFAAEVWIEPAGTVSPWGDPAVHELFESVVRMSDGSWRMVQSGTGP